MVPTYGLIMAFFVAIYRLLKVTKKIPIILFALLQSAIRTIMLAFKLLNASRWYYPCCRVECHLASDVIVFESLSTKASTKVLCLL